MRCQVCSGIGCGKCSYTGKAIIHSYRETNERYTPPHLISLVKCVLGTIDCDPASSEIANRVVGANTYYTREENGLTKDWNGKVFCNPPYGRLHHFNGGYQKLFVDKGLQEYRANRAREIIFLLLGNILFTSVGRDLWEYPLCMFEDTVLFYNERNEPCSYGFGILFMYVGPNTCRFRSVFEPYGHVSSGRHVCH